MTYIVTTIEEKCKQEEIEKENKLYQNIIEKIAIILDKDRTNHTNPTNQTNYLLISDNIQIKHKIIEKYPHIKTLFHQITHLGEGVNLDSTNEKEIQMKNTLLDMYLLSYSKSINSFSTYIHGSGFSKWTAETYNIPYICTYLS